MARKSHTVADYPLSTVLAEYTRKSEIIHYMSPDEVFRVPYRYRMTKSIVNVSVPSFPPKVYGQARKPSPTDHDTP